MPEQTGSSLIDSRAGCWWFCWTTCQGCWSLETRTLTWLPGTHHNFWEEQTQLQRNIQTFQQTLCLKEMEMSHAEYLVRHIFVCSNSIFPFSAHVYNSFHNLSSGLIKKFNFYLHRSLLSQTYYKYTQKWYISSIMDNNENKDDKDSIDLVDKKKESSKLDLKLQDCRWK